MLNSIIHQLIKEAHKLLQENQATVANEFNIEEDLPLLEVDKRKFFKSVLGNQFHFIDQAKLPMQYKYKALYFCSLYTVIFIMNKDDMEIIGK